MQNSSKNVTVIGNGAIGYQQAVSFSLSGARVTIVGSFDPYNTKTSPNEITYKTQEISEIKDEISKVHDIETHDLLRRFQHLPLLQNRLQSILNNNNLTNENLDSETALHQLKDLETFKLNTGSLSFTREKDLFSLGKQDLVIVAVKTFNMSDALAQRILPIIGESTPVVVAANGLIPYDKQLKTTSNQHVNDFIATIGEKHIIGGVLNYASAIQKTQHHVIATLKTPSFLTRITLGYAIDSEKSRTLLSKTHNLYEKTNINPIVDERGINPPMLEKLAANLSNGATSAIFGLNVGECLANESVLLITKQALHEFFQIADAYEIDINAANADDFTDSRLQFMSNFSKHRPSMLIDLEQSKPIEKQTILKAAVEVAEKSKINIPIITKISELVDMLDKQRILKKGTQNSGVKELQQEFRNAVKDPQTALQDFLNISLKETQKKLQTPPDNSRTL